MKSPPPHIKEGASAQMLLLLEGRALRNWSWARVRNTEQGTPEMGGSAGNLLHWLGEEEGDLWGLGLK